MYKGKEWQFKEGEQPEGAVELRAKAVKPPNKAKKPAVKRRAVKKK